MVDTDKAREAEALLARFKLIDDILMLQDNLEAALEYYIMAGGTYRPDQLLEALRHVRESWHGLEAEVAAVYEKLGEVNGQL